MTTAPMLRQKTHGVSAVGIGSSDWLASLCSEQLAEHVERRGLGHAALLPAIDSALADSAEQGGMTTCNALAHIMAAICLQPYRQPLN